MSAGKSARSPHESLLREYLLLCADFSRSYGPNLFVGRVDDGSMLIVQAWLNMGGDDRHEYHDYTPAELRKVIADIKSIDT